MTTDPKSTVAEPKPDAKPADAPRAQRTATVKPAHFLVDSVQLGERTIPAEGIEVPAAEAKALAAARGADGKPVVKVVD